ncbi:MAG TPA: GGDEF domain-containing protein [Thermoanaerobaculia bacterium]
MHRSLDALFAHWRPLSIAAAAAGGVAALGWIDYTTGYELSFSIFYLAPIALAAWYAGGAGAAALCLLSAATWLYVDLAAGSVYSHPAIPVWNAVVRLGFFALVSGLLVSLRAHLRNEERLARRDGLTGLLNARAFKEEATVQLQLAARQRRPCALGYLDLDDFKLVNDRLGHSEGDRALVEVSHALGVRLRATDVVGRVGGDELAVFLPDTEAEGAGWLFAEVAASLRELFAARGWPMGASFGVAAFEVAPATLDEALHCADSLMYEVKARGKSDILVRRFHGTTAAA